MTCDQFFRSALHRPAALGDVSLIKYLIEEGLSMDKRDKFGQIPLFYSVLNGRKEAVLYLLRIGGGRNTMDNMEQTLLHHAAKEGHLEIVQILTYSLDGKHLSEAVIKKDVNGKLPVHLAKQNNKINVVRYLVSLSC